MPRKHDLNPASGDPRVDEHISRVGRRVFLVFVRLSTPREAPDKFKRILKLSQPSLLNGLMHTDPDQRLKARARIQGMMTTRMGTPRTVRIRGLRDMEQW